jgi:hypothetical protein
MLVVVENDYVLWAELQSDDGSILLLPLMESGGKFSHGIKKSAPGIFT